MAMTTILQYNSTSEKALQDAINALRQADLSGNVTLGPHIQDKNAIQVTTEGDPKSITTTLRPVLGNTTTTLTLPYSILSSAGPATFPVVEYVQNFFPISKLTPEFKAQKEDDFVKFFTHLVPGGPKADPGKVVMEWSEEVEHPDVEGGKAKCWTVCRGWHTMEDFLKGLETEEFKKAIPILYAWGAPYKMWHVETKFQNGHE